jgi:putative SOS response-associated peptidase YedK
MCGRYIHPDTAAIERHWHIGRNNSDPFAARYNVSPTTLVPMLRHDSNTDGLDLLMARWSFVPHWWKQSKPPTMTINARLEEATTKPMWRDAFRTGRYHIAIPALEWYEWQTKEQLDPATGEVRPYKQPFIIRRADSAPFCFAGLMSRWQPRDAEQPIVTAAILTKNASASTESVHDRMPVVLPDALLDAWLDPTLQGSAEATELLAKAQTEFVHYAVRTLVNNARNEGEQLVEPLVVAAHASHLD